jgi:hypothetical protein
MGIVLFVIEADGSLQVAQRELSQLQGTQVSLRILG